MKTIIGLAALARSGKDTVAEMLLKHDNVTAFALADPLKSGCQALFGLSSEEAWNDTIKEEVIEPWGLSPRQMFQAVGTEWMRNHNPEHWLMRADKQLNHTHIDQSHIPTTDQLSDPDAPFRLATQAIFGLTHEQTWHPEHQSAIDPYWSISPNDACDLIKSLTYSNFKNYKEERKSRTLQKLDSKQLNLENKSVIIIKDIRFDNEADYLRSNSGIIWHITRNNAMKVSAHSSENGIERNSLDLVIENNGTLDELQQKVDNAWLITMARVSP